MDRFLSLAAPEREAMIRETAARMQLHPTPVEKDFWVCWVLRELFALSSVEEHLIFKGGTSLSKAYGVIQRFSENIDLSVDSKAFGFEIDPDFDELSTSQRDNRIKKLYRNARYFVKDALIPELTERIEQNLGEMEWAIGAGNIQKDLYTLNFEYPKTLPSTSTLHYARPVVQIELGVRSEHEPSEQRSITPYVAEQFTDHFDDPVLSIKVLAAERTFWGKVTLLHAESSRPIEDPLPPRLARHVYDLHQLMVSGIGDKALHDTDLLERVARHKAAFYAQNRVDYEETYSGKLQIVPNSKRLEEMKRDYSDMRDFFMNEPPDFDDILASLGRIETLVNRQ